MEKDTLTIANLILDHHIASGDKSVGVPLKSFEQRQLSPHDVRIALSILSKKGAVRDYHKCWGRTKMEEGIAIFEEISTDKPKNLKDDDGIELYEAYHITVEPKILKQFLGLQKSVAEIKKAGLITQRGEDFYLKDEQLHFVDKDSIHYKLFTILFGDDAESKTLPYEAIDKELTALGEEKVLDRDKMIRRIKNAVNNGLYYRVDKRLRQYVKTKPRYGVTFTNPAA